MHFFMQKCINMHFSMHFFYATLHKNVLYYALFYSLFYALFYFCRQKNINMHFLMQIFNAKMHSVKWDSTWSKHKLEKFWKQNCLAATSGSYKRLVWWRRLIFILLNWVCCWRPKEQPLPIFTGGCCKVCTLHCTEDLYLQRPKQVKDFLGD